MATRHTNNYWLEQIATEGLSGSGGYTTSLALKTDITDETGSGSLVFATSPTLVTPILGTPTSGNLANCTGLPASGIASGTIAQARLGTGSGGLGTKFLADDQTYKTIAGGGDALTSVSLAQFAATTSLELKGVLSDETGSGAVVFATSPTLVTPILGTPTSGTLTNCTGYTVANISGAGTGVLTALAVNVGSAGAPVLFNGAAGTPSSITLTNASGTAASLTAGTASAVAVGGITGLGTGVATALAINTGSAGAPVLLNGAGGTPSSITLTNASGTAASLTAGTASAVAVGGITGLGTGVATALAVNVGSAGAPVVLNGAGGTPSSMTLTNATGLPVAGITASTSTALGVGSIELGHATQTTLTGSAGVLSVEGTAVPTISSTNTLTNKRVTPRVTTIVSNAAPTINTDDYDFVDITALAAAISTMSTNLSGSPTNGQKLMFRIRDDGTARALAWGASFVAKGVALPTTTVISKDLHVGFVSNGSTWGCIASAQEA